MFLFNAAKIQQNVGKKSIKMKLNNYLTFGIKKSVWDTFGTHTLLKH